MNMSGVKGSFEKSFIEWKGEKMITESERKFIVFMIRCRIWKIKIQMCLPDVLPRWGTRWILKRIKRRQVVDDLHHAPCCPANHYHKTRLVFRKCSCGAGHIENEDEIEEIMLLQDDICGKHHG